MNTENLEDRILPNIEDAFYPPILDTDPELAASYLTIFDSEFFYNAMLNAFEGLKNKENKYILIQEAITYSYPNFKWFSTFFKTLEKLITSDISYEVPFSLAPAISIGKPVFQPPFHLLKLKSGEYKVEYDEIKIRSPKITDKYRYLYIGKDLELEDFRDGLPAWYLMKDSTIFENYNEKTNSRVRIDFIKGELLYYVAGASDNWIPVENVPAEIDDVVLALLYRNSYIDATDKTKVKVN